MDRIRIIAVIGPTGVGKTEYAIELAKKLDGEIVSADSMQIYRHMTIGSAKPTVEQQAAVPHHMVDLVDPWEPWTVADYQREAQAAIKDVTSRGKLPILSGGTGLYVHSLLFTMDFSNTPENEELRSKLYREAETFGKEYIHQKLSAIDEEAAARIHPNNLKKVIRAIEIASAGDKVTEFHNSLQPNDAYDPVFIGLERDRIELYERIDKRVDSLMRYGLVEEVKGLLTMGLSAESIAMQGIGYKEIVGFLAGDYNEEEAVRLIKQHSRNYAKRQYTWFRRYQEVRWFDLSGGVSANSVLNQMLAHIDTVYNEKKESTYGKEDPSHSQQKR
ncbi:MAG: tRNA (adenosine(37)-N6)-dimethylallyltransferase MiaA [Firmicutes bacterium HGW-Firmicutes-11]|jgi:tRNA dimethylallyltransferase|nr:MAG: tRNA (adenosine(37)-N6)-dimethylallyltransferase MiaA [Firmicutes bacterium HGW-Firmicutes-11]